MVTHLVGEADVHHGTKSSIYGMRTRVEPVKIKKDGVSGKAKGYEAVTHLGSCRVCIANAYVLGRTRTCLSRVQWTVMTMLERDDREGVHE